MQRAVIAQVKAGSVPGAGKGNEWPDDVKLMKATIHHASLNVQQHELRTPQTACGATECHRWSASRPAGVQAASICGAPPTSASHLPKLNHSAAIPYREFCGTLRDDRLKAEQNPAVRPTLHYVAIGRHQTWQPCSNCSLAATRWRWCCRPGHLAGDNSAPRCPTRRSWRQELQSRRNCVNSSCTEMRWWHWLPPTAQSRWWPWWA